MTLQSSGPIKLSDIAAEFGVEAPYTLSDFYGANVSVPSSGPIKLSDFYGISNKWGSQTQLIGSDTDENDLFGGAVAISSDGSTLIVGATRVSTGAINAGAAYIFTRSGGAWTQQAKLESSPLLAQNGFGHDVDISADGNTVIVSEPGQQYSGTIAGSAYVFTRSGTAWSLQAKLLSDDSEVNDVFGSSVSISNDGNTAIVCKKIDGSVEYNSGAAYVFTRIGSTWTQLIKLKASPTQEGARLGNSVDISGDGTRFIVGANDEEGSAYGTGAAYIFKRSPDGSTWSQEALLESADIQSLDSFGISVAINSDGSRCVVGANLEDTGGSAAGSAYVFTRSGAAWTQEAKIQSTDVQAGDNLSVAVAISDDGNTVFIGANKEDTSGLDAGAAYVFTVSGTTWSQEVKLLHSPARTYDEFGIAVAINDDGTRGVVGAWLEDTNGSTAGSVYVCE